MEKKNIQRIMKMAQQKEFKDAEYCNDVIAAICEDFLKKMAENEDMKQQLSNPQITYPHQCYVMETGDGVVVFTERYEAEMFRAAVGATWLVRTVEFFNDHRKAAFKFQQQFLFSK